MTLNEMMERSGVRFGTSGARGLASALTDQVAYVYTRGFLQYLAEVRVFARDGGRVAVAGDLRPSTGRLIDAVSRAIADAGHEPVPCGRIPSPAVALYGLRHRIPAVMVTGSHIPADRNGIKFNTPRGEILKAEESGIAAQSIDCPAGLFDSKGASTELPGMSRPVEPAAIREYAGRYLELWEGNALEGLRIGIYQHSAVGRDLLVEIMEGLGARAKPMGRSEAFVPVDTEAIRPQDIEFAARAAAEQGFDAIVSTDGDGDRPLISDEHGRWLRGDVAGVLCARYLEADSVSVPVSCNTAVERSGWFKDVRRTRIGSPYVIESMMQAEAAGAQRVVGYEANGGFLIQTDLEWNGRMLRALPTRDSVILIIAILLLSRRERKTVSELVRALPPRYTASDRLESFPSERSRALLGLFSTGDSASDRRVIEEFWGGGSGPVKGVDRTDGLRISFENGEIVHLRPSGNAPEFRCYTEASSEERARELNCRCLDRLRGWTP